MSKGKLNMTTKKDQMQLQLENNLAYQKIGGKKRIYFVGESGIGKTQLITDYAKNTKTKLHILNVSAMDETDFMGIPYVCSETNSTKFGKPSFLNCELLFIDEMDKNQNEAVEAVLLSLLNDSSVNGHNFDGQIVCGGNVVKDEYKNQEFGMAMKDRIIQVPFTRTKKESISYFRSLHKMPEQELFINFIEANDDNPEHPYFLDKSPRAIDQCLINLQIKNQFASLDIIGTHLGQNIAYAFESYRDEVQTNLDAIISGQVQDFSEFSSALRAHHIKQLGNGIRSGKYGVDHISKMHDYIHTFNGDDIATLKELVHELIENDLDAITVVGKELFSNKLLQDCKELLKAGA